MDFNRWQLGLLGKIKPLFTQSHLPASAPPLPPCSLWGPRLGSARPPWHTPGQGLARSAPRQRRATPWWPPARKKEGLLPTR